ncbi:hypothetical protein MNBD_UNCLBAC01-1199 [hydrothermal vent metagenome]|uniref:Uncharacterized protein n=1 Tax=hydrothermal vent metagenome TaxID=652676 RepID=A0A3B1DIR3_9ZZZZ
MNISQNKIKNNEIKPETEKIQRPWFVTILCVLGVLLSGYMFFTVVVFYFFSRGFTQEGKVMMIVLNLIAIAHLVISYSYWMMKRWGLYVYSISLVSGYNPFIYNMLQIHIFSLATLFFIYRRELSKLLRSKSVTKCNIKNQNVTEYSFQLDQ